MNFSSLRAALLLGLVLLTACAPSARPTAGPSVQDLAATIAVATLNAKAAQATAAAAAHPTVADTPTTKPTLFINAATANCRSGPGPDFRVIAALAAGTSVDLAGKDSVHNYWIVVDPTSHDLCWIAVQDATPAGSFDSLAEITPQPVTIAVPGKPNKGAWNFACDNSTLTTVLAWYPPSGTVNGYRIYREGSQIADLPPTEKSYTEKVPFRYGSNMSYAVAAYNEAGTSQQLTWNFHCP